MSSDRIKLLPISDNPHAGDFAKAIIDQLAATFGLTFEQLGGRIVGRVGRFHTGGVVRSGGGLRPGEIPVVLQGGYDVPAQRARRAMDVYRREYTSICAIYLIGYDPQRLLEDHRG